jgi:hypothetical protein
MATHRLNGWRCSCCGDFLFFDSEFETIEYLRSEIKKAAVSCGFTNKFYFLILILIKEEVFF